MTSSATSLRIALSAAPQDDAHATTLDPAKTLNDTGQTAHTKRHTLNHT
jgi:hypothetical protein